MNNDPLSWIYVKGFIGLDGVRMHNDQKIGVIELTHIQTQRRRFPNSLDIPPSNVRVSGQISQLLNLADKNIIGIFLVYLPDTNLIRHAGLHGSKKLSQEHVSLLRKNLADFAIVR